MKVYQVKADYYYGEDRDAKKAKRLELLQSLNLTEESDGNVYCNAEMAITLLIAGYAGTSYIELSHIKEIKVGGVDDTVEIIRSSTSLDGHSEAFNYKCRSEQPTPWLHQVVRTMLLQDACTDQLQLKISEGWRIVAVQPQPDQRRPDYILGRNDPELPTEAERPRLGVKIL